MLVYNHTMNQPPKIPFTKDTYDQFSKDVEKYNKLRQEVLVRLQTAREMGDLSENGAYKYAKFELGNVNRQLRELHYNLRYGFVAQKTQVDVVDFGNTVTVQISGKNHTYTLVSDRESNPTQNKLSLQSPVGQALFGKRVGDTVTVDTPMGSKTYTITDIS